jgi:NADH dehydrogenase (ubiquinone) 1 beta subcomplex subunit 9
MIPVRFRAPALAHTLTITRLYRKSLRECINHYWQRPVCRQKQLICRERFDLHRHEENPIAIARLVAEAETILQEYAHQQPYISPTAPDGSKWERNLVWFFSREGVNWLISLCRKSCASVELHLLTIINTSIIKAFLYSTFRFLLMDGWMDGCT